MNAPVAERPPLRLDTLFAATPTLPAAPAIAPAVPPIAPAAPHRSAAAPSAPAPSAPGLAPEGAAVPPGPLRRPARHAVSARGAGLPWPALWWLGLPAGVAGGLRGPAVGVLTLGAGVLGVALAATVRGRVESLGLTDRRQGLTALLGAGGLLAIGAALLPAPAAAPAITHLPSPGPAAVAAARSSAPSASSTRRTTLSASLIDHTTPVSRRPAPAARLAHPARPGGPARPTHTPRAATVR